MSKEPRKTTTIRIPETMLRDLKVLAANTGTSFNKLVLDGIRAVLIVNKKGKRG